MLLLLIFLSHSLIFRCQFDVCSSRNSSTIKLSLLHHVLSAVCGSYNFRVVTTHNRVSPRTKFSREGADGKSWAKCGEIFGYQLSCPESLLCIVTTNIARFLWKYFIGRIKIFEWNMKDWSTFLSTHQRLEVKLCLHLW